MRRHVRLSGTTGLYKSTPIVQKHTDAGIQIQRNLCLLRTGVVPHGTSQRRTQMSEECRVNDEYVKCTVASPWRSIWTASLLALGSHRLRRMIDVNVVRLRI